MLSSNKTVLACALALVFTGSAFANTDIEVVPPMSAEQVAEDKVVAEIVETEEVVIETNITDPADDVEAMISKKLSAMEAAIAAQGKSHSVKLFSGTAPVPVSKEDPMWSKYRAAAFDRAIANARQSYLMTIDKSVIENQIATYFNDEGLPAPTKADFRSDSTMKNMWDKMIAVVDGKVVAQLEEMGIDSTIYKTSPPQKKQKLLEDSLMREIVTTAGGKMSGMVLSQTAEAYESNGKGHVGVIMVMSANKREQIEFMLKSKGNVMPTPEKANPKYTNIAQAFADMENIHQQKGINLVYDDKGYPMIVSYGQAGVKYTSDSSRRHQNRKQAKYMAEADAWGSIAAAYGLNGQFEGSVTTSQATSEDRTATLNYDGDLSVVTSDIQHSLREIMSNTSKYTAQVKNLNGVRVAYPWRKVHPATGHEMVGAVLVWHPISAQESIRLQSNASAKSIDEAATPSVKKTETKSGSSYSSSSDNAFDAADF